MPKKFSPAAPHDLPMGQPAAPGAGFTNVITITGEATGIAAAAISVGQVLPLGIGASFKVTNVVRQEVPPDPTPAGLITIDVGGLTPRTLTAKAGDTVTWTNKQLRQNAWIRADDSTFESKDIAPGKSWSRVFPKAGSYLYREIYNGNAGQVGPWNGVVTVTGTTPLPAPGKLGVVTLAPAQVKSGGASTLTAQLSGPATASVTLQLAYSQGVSGPATITLAAGYDWAKAEVQAAAGVTGTATVTVTDGTVTRIASLSVVADTVPTPTPTKLINVRDTGAKGDGKADDRAAIQQALDAAVSGGTVYFPAGSYFIGGELSLAKSGVSHTGDGDASRLLHEMRRGMHIPAGVQDVAISKLCCFGAPGKWNAEGNGAAHAILCEGKNLTVEDVLLIAPGNGIYQAGDADGMKLNRIRVQGFGRVGFGLGDGAEVTDCTLIQDDPKDGSHGSGHAFYLHNGCERVKIRNCKVVGARMYGLHCYGEATGLPTGPVSVTDSVFQDCFGTLIVANYPAEAARVQGLIIKGCQFVGGYGGDSVIIKQGDGVEFSDNLIHGSPNIGLSIGMWRADEPGSILRRAIFKNNRIEACAFGLLAGVPVGRPGAFEACRIQGTTFAACPREQVIYEVSGLVVA